jgi:hypothetical protein
VTTNAEPAASGLVTAVEFSRGEWVVTLACPEECTAETCSNFGSLLVIGRGQFRTAQDAIAYREQMHRDDPALIRLADLQARS